MQGMRLRSMISRLVYWIIITIGGIVLSVGFKDLFGAPNYGLGIVISTTAACYLYGLAAAVFCFMGMVFGVYALAVEITFIAAIPRLVTIFITSCLTCYLVLQLRASIDKLSEQNGFLVKARKELAEALKRERRIAVTMQRAFMPRIPNRLGSVSIESFYEPGSDEAEIGGDFLDVFELRNGLIAIALGDVSGKGVDAARQAVITQCGLRTYARESAAPDETLLRLNSMLIDDRRFRGFVTLFYAVLDQSSGRMTYATGGHEPPAVYRARSKTVETLNTNGQPLAVIANAEESSDTLILESGDIVFAYTDGLTEARIANGAMIGTGKVEQLLALNADNEDLREVVHNTVEQIRAFAGGRFRDDVAIVAFRIGF